MRPIIGSYFLVSNLQESIQFYTELLQFPPTVIRGNRWAEWLWAEGQGFFGLLSDPDNATEVDFGTVKPSAVLNIFTPNIEKEYTRCLDFVESYFGMIHYDPELATGATGDYTCFGISDPDGNMIEIFHCQEDEQLAADKTLIRHSAITTTVITSKTDNPSGPQLPTADQELSGTRRTSRRICDFNREDLAIPRVIALP